MEKEIFKKSSTQFILKKMGSCIDMRSLQDANAIQDAYSMLVSGKKGYKAVIERKKIPPKCVKCGKDMDNRSWVCDACNDRENTLDMKFSALKNNLFCL
jgi:hypothetical protein